MIRIVSKHRASAADRQSLAAQGNKTELEISLKGCDSGDLLTWHIHVAFFTEGAVDSAEPSSMPQQSAS